MWKNITSQHIKIFQTQTSEKETERKGKENDNLEEDVNAIDSDYELNQNPLIKENTDLDSFLMNPIF